MTTALKSLSTLLILSMTLSGALGCGRDQLLDHVEPPEPIIPEPKTNEVASHTVQPQGGIEAAAVTQPRYGTVPDSEAVNIGKQRDLIHKVKWNRETLYTIALWYTGNGGDWKRLVAANPHINPRRMQIGEKVRIPEALLITRRPLSADFIESVAIRKNKSAPNAEPELQKPSKQKNPIQAPPLYGPLMDDRPLEEERNTLPVPLETIDQ